MSIGEKQNTPDLQRLLVARRYVLRQAKKLHFVGLTGAIALAGIAPFILVLWPDSKIMMSVIGGIWTLVSHVVLKDLENESVKQGATIQEQFDVALFDLPWNQILAGDRLSPEVIYSADRKFKGDREQFKNWYGHPGNVSYPLDVLLCQRACLVWDSRLRRCCAWIVGVVTAGLFGLGVGVAVVTNQTVLSYILALFIPSLSALLQGFEVTKEHFRIATEREHLQKKAFSLWESCVNNPGAISVEQCRQIQDRLYSLRSKGPLVPDWLYLLLRNKYQFDMESAMAELESGVK